MNEIPDGPDPKMFMSGGEPLLYTAADLESARAEGRREAVRDCQNLIRKSKIDFNLDIKKAAHRQLVTYLVRIISSLDAIAEGREP